MKPLLLDIRDLNCGDPVREQALITGWNRAMRDFGFVFLIGHDMENEYRSIEEEAQQFFQLPEEEKKKWDKTKFGTAPGLAGYSPPKLETIARTLTRGVSDILEALDETCADKEENLGEIQCHDSRSTAATETPNEEEQKQFLKDGDATTMQRDISSNQSPDVAEKQERLAKTRMQIRRRAPDPVEGLLYRAAFEEVDETDPESLRYLPQNVNREDMRYLCTKFWPQKRTGYARGDELVNRVHASYDKVYAALSENVHELCALSLNLPNKDYFKIRHGVFDPKEMVEQRKNNTACWFGETGGAKIASYNLGASAEIDEEAKRNKTMQSERQAKEMFGAHTDWTGFTYLWRNRTNGLEALVGTPGYYALKAEYSGVCDEKVLKERGVEKLFWLRCPAKMSELFKNNDTADEIIVDLNGVPFRSDIQDLISAAKKQKRLETNTR